MSTDLWWWRGRRGSATLGFTRRGGGISTDDWAGLNLGAHVGDDPAAVERNRELVLASLQQLSGASLPPRPVFMRQVHGAAVRGLQDIADLTEPVPESDGVVTALPDVALFALIADCTPVLFWDNEAGVIGAAHAGRPGMLAGVVPATVAAMRDLGAREIAAAIGPSVCGRCYEVPEDMRSEAIATEPVSGAVTWTGTPAIDVATGVADQLRRAGVVETTWVAGCSREESGLYSYRRDGTTGRFAGVIVQSQAGRIR